MTTKAPNLREIALRLRDLGSLVRCLPVPSAHNPEAFHINRSELAHRADLIAFELWPEGRPPASEPRVKPGPNVNGMARSPRRR